MNYETNFTAITTSGREIPSRTVGVGYANLYYAEGEINSGNIIPNPADEVALYFDRIEDFLYDLYRHTDRQSFKLTQYVYDIGDDGEPYQNKQECTSLVTLQDLQEFIIASYSDITLPVMFTLSRESGSWCYRFSFRYAMKFEIS